MSELQQRYDAAVAEVEELADTLDAALAAHVPVGRDAHAAPQVLAAARAAVGRALAELREDRDRHSRRLGGVS